LTALLDHHPGRIAAVFLEQATATLEPEPGFLEGLRSLADRHGFVLVFDEMITGMRWSVGGAQAVYGVVPDLSTWGKALANGFSVSALAGKRDIMELGGLNTDQSRVWLLSTTHGGETTGLAALLATYDAYAERDIVGIMESQGEKLRAGVTAAAAERGLQDHIQVVGRASNMVFVTRDAEERPSQDFRTLFLQELMRRGVLGPSFVLSAAHTDEDLALTVHAVGEAMDVYAKAVADRSTHGYVVGRSVAPAVREYAAPRRWESLA
jgi:glutamate-1-semialdehyde 2,1-aminomutase